MSQFDFPRLHFRGRFLTNVGTANNDDYGSPPYVDSAHVRVDTGGMTDPQFATWLQQFDPGFGIRGGWNLYGDGGCRFQDAACHATEPAFGTLATTPGADPAVNATVRLLGGVMVDLDPEGTTSTQIFAGELRLEAPGNLRIQGRPTRACSRWVGRRNLGVGGFAAFAAVWHSVIPPQQLTISPGSSPSLAALEAAHQAGNGLFLRYCTYLLDPLIPAAQLAADFAAGRRTVNPAIGLVLGTIGVWNPAETSTFGEGRRLNAGAAATVDHVRFALNPATVGLDSGGSRISIDLINSIPERDAGLEKVDLGPLSLALTYSDQGTVRTDVIGSVPNSRATYEARSGLVDLPVPANLSPFMSQGRLSIIQNTTGTPLLDEVPLVLETDDRATYLNEADSTDIRIRGWSNGAPAGGVRVTLRQYVTTDKTFAQAPPATPVVQCPDFVDLGADGRATISIRALNPGCTTLTFTGPGLSDEIDFFACVRVLPRDDLSAIPDDQLDFPLVYRECLRYYHLLHPAMDAIFDLSDETAVSAAIDPIRSRVTGTSWEDPRYMPRTRDMSAGKIRLLERWCDKVAPD